MCSSSFYVYVSSFLQSWAQHSAMWIVSPLTFCTKTATAAEVWKDTNGLLNTCALTATGEQRLFVDEQQDKLRALAFQGKLNWFVGLLAHITVLDLMQRRMSSLDVLAGINVSDSNVTDSSSWSCDSCMTCCMSKKERRIMPPGQLLSWTQHTHTQEHKHTLQWLQ